MTRTSQKSRFQVVLWPIAWDGVDDREANTEILYTGSWGCCRAFKKGVEYFNSDHDTLRMRRKKARA